MSDTSTRDRVFKEIEKKEVRFVADADGLYQFTAEEAGRCHSVTCHAGVACDGTNGLEIFVLNRDDSDNPLAYIGFGSGTEASKPTDVDVAVAAYETATVINESNRAATDRCRKGDFIEILIDRDGTAFRGTVTVNMDYDGIGR